MAGKAPIVVGILILALGVVTIFMGIFYVPNETASLLHSGIRDMIVVDSNTSQGYSNWAGGQDVDNPYYMVFYFWNLTNPSEIAFNPNVKPNYTSVGPYYYRRYRTSVNVSFPDDGNQIQYSNLKIYQFESDLSASSDTAMITNINPAYLAALAQASGPLGLNAAGTGSFIKPIIDFMTGPFVSLYTTYSFPQYFVAQMDATISLINATVHNTTLATSMFIDTWLNAQQVVTVPGQWGGMLVSGFNNTYYNGSIVTPPAGISAAIGANLLNPNVNLSLLNFSSTSPNTAFVWSQAMTNTTCMNMLVQALGLTPFQIQMIMTWLLSSFSPAYVYPVWIRNFDIDQVSDIGWVQWVLQTPLSGNLVGAMWDLSGFGFYSPQIELTAPELDEQEFPNWRAARSLFDFKNGLGNATVFQDMLQAYTFYQYNPPDGLFGLTTDQMTFVFQYAVDFGSAHMPIWLAQQYDPIYAGAFVTKSVYDWVFACSDPLISLLQPVNTPSCNMLFNNTYFLPTTVWSGKDNMTKANMYVKWRDQAVLENMWAEPVPVFGYTDLGQFGPEATESGNGPSFDNYWVFDTDFMKSLRMNYSGDSEVAGIKTRRYVLDFNSTFSPDPIYYQSMYGVTNVTSSQNGAPIFISLWDMLYVPNANTTINGLNMTNEWDDSTYVDVEPITGSTLNARERLQINAYVPSGTSWVTSITAPTGILYPIAKAGEYGTVSDSMANMIKSKLNLVPQVNKATFVIAVCVGPVLVLLGAVLIYLGARKYWNGYNSIN